MAIATGGIVTELQVDDHIRDNDHRMPNRVLMITCVGGVAVSATDGKRTVGILKRRIFTDGKLRRSGFTLLQREDESCT